MQSQVRFNRVPEKVPEKVWEALSGEGLGGFGAVGEGSGGLEALVQSQVQQRSREGSREGVGGFGAEPCFQQRFREGSREVPGEALVQSQVRFNRVPEKVPEKVPASLGAKPVKFNGFRKRLRRRLGGFAAVSKALAGVGHLNRTCKDAFSVAGTIQETCSSEMFGGPGADFLRGVAFWSMRPDLS